MAKRTYGHEYGFATRAVHTGNDVDAETGAIRRPLVMANSYELPYDPSQTSWSTPGANMYTRNGGSNQGWLQEKLASLSNAEDCVFLGSGVAAVNAMLFSLLEKGDHVVFADVTYLAVYRLLKELLVDKWGIETTMVDTTDPENVRKAMRPNTKLVHIETPGNPTLNVSDIAAIAEIAHAGGALLSVDNTFASPYCQRPLDLGADLVIESTTKYINGHGDAMGGAVLGKKELLDVIRVQAQVNQGAAPSPFNAWLTMRGLSTLPLRMRQHNESALKIAKWLEANEKVRFVAYPGLESHAGHEVAKKQMMNGFGGVMSFGLKADHDSHCKFVSKLKIITNAVSLGHDESLIVFLGEDDERQYIFPEEFSDGFFRFSVGLEDADDLIRDLEQALAQI